MGVCIPAIRYFFGGGGDGGNIFVVFVVKRPITKFLSMKQFHPWLIPTNMLACIIHTDRGVCARGRR